MSPPTTRLLVVAFVAASLVAGGFFFVRSFRPPAGSEGREENVAPAPAGGRTQALPGGEDPVDAPAEDPLQPGITEAPDVPASAAHAGIKKIGERIRDAVLLDGVVGDTEVPGVEFASSMPQAQRRWFVETAPGILCGCGCGQDLLECRRDDLSCPLSPAMVDSLMAVARGR